MRNHFLTSLLLVSMPLLFQDCTRTPCINASLGFGLVSFTDAEADTIILRRFAKNRNFTLLIDTVHLQTGFIRKQDTLESAYNTSAGLIYSSYDYELYFPGAAQTYRLTEITEEFREIRHSIFSNVKVGCENRIGSLKVNNQPVSPPAYNYFYLSR
ncbi:MAG: hypothetical protein HYZ15_10100 [Sphingobacteriales bacterium]|nr:hypothetical protein [Sphingobacteriales bacterium]